MIRCIISLVFLYFSDWTTQENLKKLEEKGFPQAGKLIKVFASYQDPSAKLGRQITVIEKSGEPFDLDKKFKYAGRSYWLGLEMEEYLDHFRLTPEAKQKTRALFRFADSPEMEITQLAMSLAKDASGSYRYRHPLAIVDGLTEAMERGRFDGLHLDIFTQRSIGHLASLINLESTEGLVTLRESTELTKSTREGFPPTKESR